MRLKFRKSSMIYLGSAQEACPVPIVADAAVATVGVGNGKLIPLVILDTTQRPDLIEVVHAQAHFPPGDCITTWGALQNRRDHVALFIGFQRPIERTAIVEFEISRQGILVEHILLSGALYIQSGQAGDRLKHDLDRPKILIEVADTGFRPKWDKLFYNGMLRRVKKEGIRGLEAKQATAQYIEKIKELSQFRMSRKMTRNQKS